VAGSCEHGFYSSGNSNLAVLVLLTICEELAWFFKQAKYSTCIFVTKFKAVYSDDEDGAVKQKKSSSGE
jgi:hypothetical protein